MPRRDLETILEALEAAHVEITALIDDDVHIPSGNLLEQIETAIKLCENTLG